MNLLQSIKALSLILMLSVSGAYPMALVNKVWNPVQETIMREGRRARWNFEVVKSKLPEHSGAFAAGALALTLGTLAYNHYNRSNTVSDNNYASPAQPIAAATIPVVVQDQLQKQPATDGSASFSEPIIVITPKITKDVFEDQTQEKVETPLHQAVRGGNLKEVQKILATFKTSQAKLAAINKNNPDGFSALRLANELDKLDILEFLMNERRSLI